MTAHGPKPAPAHHAHVEAHRIGRYEVGEVDIQIPAVDVPHARREAILAAHRRAGPPLPPWRPLIRQSWPYSSAEAVEPVALLRVQESPAQLTLDGLERAA